MKGILLSILESYAWLTAITAGIDSVVHNLCKNLSDYVGCVKQTKILIHKKYKS